MPRRQAAASLVQVGLDPAATVPLHQQLYEQLRDAILQKRLTSGSRLPSTRTLAAELDVSRNTVMNAFEQLLAEGYLEGKLGSGTFVSRDLPDDILRVRNQEIAMPIGLGGQRKVSRRAEAVRPHALCCAPTQTFPRPFRSGCPSIDQFPLTLWERVVADCWRNATKELLTYGHSAGYRPLRDAIAAYVREARGVACSPEQVIVTSGCQQALDVTARVLFDIGDAVWMEDPGYLGAKAALAGAGVRTIPVHVDREGIDIAHGIARAENARGVYVTPSHQYPLGVTMSLARRLALLAWADRAGAWIIEDDYDSEFRYIGRPLTAIQALDASKRVIYIGSFSKVLVPSIRLGYLIVPADLVDTFLATRSISNLHCPILDQMAVARFMQEGHFARHIRRMRSIYAERQQTLVEEARAELEGMIEVAPGEAGLHLIGWLTPPLDDVKVAEAARQRGLEITPISRYSIESPDRGGLMLGFGAIQPQQIRDGVRVLARVLGTLYGQREYAGSLSGTY